MGLIHVQLGMTFEDLGIFNTTASGMWPDPVVGFDLLSCRRWDS